MSIHHLGVLAAAALALSIMPSFRSSRADGGPQVLPPARATVPHWLPAKRPIWISRQGL